MWGAFSAILLSFASTVNVFQSPDLNKFISAKDAFVEDLQMFGAVCSERLRSFLRTEGATASRPDPAETAKEQQLACTAAAASFQKEADRFLQVHEGRLERFMTKQERLHVGSQAKIDLVLKAHDDMKAQLANAVHRQRVADTVKSRSDEAAHAIPFITLVHWAIEAILFSLSIYLSCLHQGKALDMNRRQDAKLAEIETAVANQQNFVQRERVLQCEIQDASTHALQRERALQTEMSTAVAQATIEQVQLGVQSEIRESGFRERLAYLQERLTSEMMRAQEMITHEEAVRATEQALAERWEHNGAELLHEVSEVTAQTSSICGSMQSIAVGFQSVKDVVETSRRQAMLKEEFYEQHAEDLFEHFDGHQSNDAVGNDAVGNSAWQEGALAARAILARRSIELRQTLFDETKLSHSLREALADETACAAATMRSQRESQDKLAIQRRYAEDTERHLRASLEHACREEHCAFVIEQKIQEELHHTNLEERALHASLEHAWWDEYHARSAEERSQESLHRMSGELDAVVQEHLLLQAGFAGSQNLLRMEEEANQAYYEQLEAARSSLGRLETEESSLLDEVASVQQLNVRYGEAENVAQADLATSRLHFQTYEEVANASLQELRVSEAAIERQLRGFEDQVTCCICMANPRSAAVTPCNHYAFCEGCSRRLENSRCPICRIPVQSVLTIHSS